jgi:adenylate cyclase
LRGRGILIAISAGVCPVVSLLLLALVPRDPGNDSVAFALAVGGLAIVLALISAWLLGRLITAPVEALRRATRAVADGDLDVRIADLRADEFGLLIDGFNTMVADLREKRRVEENFGRHVGTRIAQQILAKDRSLAGVEEELTIMFVDIRNFTTRAEASTPTRVVALLNVFLTEIVEVIEQRHGGIVNKFLGDGLMALFGEWTGRSDHADAAGAAGQEELRSLERINEELRAAGEAPLAIGIGIHTGRAVVGSIGSPAGWNTRRSVMP